MQAQDIVSLAALATTDGSLSNIEASATDAEMQTQDIFSLAALATTDGSLSNIEASATDAEKEIADTLRRPGSSLPTSKRELTSPQNA
mmetsp:Transcript_43388/g.76874  ORF Transcript_43388/g.76874 Transcript_43388/m.76874 type:complete len:88 (-) Transcript_43388:54-317(-)